MAILGRFSLLYTFCVLSQLAVGAIVSNVADLPGLTYDFVVVGGGSAGNLIANRLTENPNVSVLVLEAGGSHEGIVNMTIPFWCPTLTPFTAVDWNYTTVPLPGLGGRSIPYMRGHVLGGSSSVNYLVYNRGTSEDFDRYAQMSGDPGWSWNALQPYFRKTEKFTPPVDGHDTTGEFDPSQHGYDGLLGVSLPGFKDPIDDRIIQVTQELPEFPFIVDHNSGKHLGVGFLQSTSANGERTSSATAFISPFVQRQNLDVLLNAQVARVGSKNCTPGTVFKTVEFTEGIGGSTVHVTARKEIVLSAGSVGTPHILLNSGIGDKAELESIGITSVLDLPSVGRNLSDHVLAPEGWLVDSVDTFDTLLRSPAAVEAATALWTEKRQGLLSDTISNKIGFARLPSDASIFQQVPDPAAGPNTGHYELLFSNGVPIPPYPPTGNFLGTTVVLLTPTSRGSITINSTDPFAAPTINPNLLGTDFDKFTMREAIRAMRRFVGAPAWTGYTTAQLNTATTDQELDAYLAGAASTIFHPMGTASMSPKGASYGVVDPDLKVKGATGLRIVDASVIPVVPSGHPLGTIYVFAERAADLIKASWGL